MIGDFVLVLEKSEDGRCKGMIGGREGWFPGNCTREGAYDCCYCSVLSRSDLGIESMLSF